MTVGAQIRTVRVRKGLTQKQLAEACGMADSAIRKYESGQITPKIETLQRIADALGVSANSLRPPDLYWEDENGIGHTEPQHDKVYLGDNLRYYRQCAGLSQKALAEKAGILLKMIRAYESDTSGYFITEADLQTLADFFDVPAENILGCSVTYEWMISGHRENCRQNVNEAMDKLNVLGLDKLAGYADDLTRIPKYREKAVQDAPQAQPVPQEAGEGQE